MIYNYKILKQKEDNEMIKQTEKQERKEKALMKQKEKKEKQKITSSLNITLSNTSLSNTSIYNSYQDEMDSQFIEDSEEDQL